MKKSRWFPTLYWFAATRYVEGDQRVPGRVLEFTWLGAVISLSVYLRSYGGRR